MSIGVAFAMIVTCPECATRYDVDDAAFSSGGRAVRCKHCGCEWYQIGPAGAGKTAMAAAGDAALGYSRDTGEAELLNIEVADASIQDRARRLAERAEALRLDDGERDDGDIETVDVEAISAGVSLAKAERVASDTVSGSITADAPLSGRGARARVEPTRSRSGGGRGVIFVIAMLLIAPVAAFFLVPGLADKAPALKALFESAPAPDGEAETAPEAAAATDAPQGEAFARTGAAATRPGAASAPSAVADGARAGVVFVETKYDLVERPEGPALEVWGAVANNGPDEALAPTIEIVTRDAAGKELQRWFASPEAERLGSGERARFASRMMYPEGPVADVDVYIANR